MADITRFPGYHGTENVVTNHTMVLLRSLYQTSPKLLEILLADIVGEELSIGPNFSQQISGTHSIPDGLLIQHPLSIFIETKLGKGFNLDQLRRHCQSIESRMADSKGCYLIALDSSSRHRELPAELMAFAEDRKIKLVALTFSQLLEHLGDLQPVDIQTADLITEFGNFLHSYRLLSMRDRTMVAMLTGTSWQDNALHGVYFEPSYRNSKQEGADYIGLYHGKLISHIGRIVTVVTGTQRQEVMVFDMPEIGNLDPLQQRRIMDSIESSQRYYPLFQRESHRFYVVDAFHPMSFSKRSKGGMLGHRYFDIQQHAGSDYKPGLDTSVVADLLNNKFFE